MAALKALTSNKATTIKMADKGNAIVVESTVAYQAKVFAHLNDSHTYEQTSIDTTEELATRINDFLRNQQELNIIDSSLLR